MGGYKDGGGDSEPGLGGGVQDGAAEKPHRWAAERDVGVKPRLGLVEEGFGDEAEEEEGVRVGGPAWWVSNRLSRDIAVHRLRSL